MFWLCAIPALCINFFTSGGRSHIIDFLVFGALIVMLRTRKIYFAQMVALLAVSLILVGVLGNFRRSTWKGDADWTTITQFNPFEAVTKDAGTELARRTSSISPVIAILGRVPQDVSLLWGSSYVGLIGFPIPKALWPEKPQGIHSLTGETFFGLQAGMPPGMVGEAYWNFHILGVIGVFLLFGLFQRGLMLFYLRNGNRPGALLLYLVLLYGLRSDSGAVAYLINILLPLAVLIPISALSLRGRHTRHVALADTERSYAN
jgi:hypothetical protein